MPNWCFNSVDVVPCNDTASAKNQLRRFKEECFNDIKRKYIEDGPEYDEKEFDFNKIIPMPESLRITSPAQETYLDPLNKAEKKTYEENVKMYGHGDWYDWACDKWGTKWNSSSTQIDREEDYCLSFSFNTAWSPPMPILYALSEKYPLLRFDTEHEEGGMGFAGRLILCKELNITMDKQLPVRQFWNEKTDDYEDNPEHDEMNKAIQEELEQEMIIHSQDMLKEMKKS
jgi:hypothetical protein